MNPPNFPACPGCRAKYKLCREKPRAERMVKGKLSPNWWQKIHFFHSQHLLMHLLVPLRCLLTKFPRVPAGGKIPAQGFVPPRAAEKVLQPPTEAKCPTAQRAVSEQGWTEPLPPWTGSSSQQSANSTAFAAWECHEKTWMDGWMEPAVSVAVCPNRQGGGALLHSTVFCALNTSSPWQIKAEARTLIPLTCKGSPFLLQLHQKPNGTNAALITWVNLTKHETNTKQRALLQLHLSKI